MKPMCITCPLVLRGGRTRGATHVRGNPKASPPQPRRLDELPDELSPDDDHHDGELHFMSLSGEGRSSVAVCLHRSSAPP